MNSNETVKKLINLIKSLAPSMSTPSLLEINQPNRINNNENEFDINKNNSSKDADNEFNKYNKLKKNAYSLANFSTTKINMTNDINLDDLEKTLMTT